MKRVVLLLILAVAAMARAQEAGLDAILVANEDWQVAVDNLGFSDGLCSDAEGNLYFSDLKKPGGLFKLAPDGTKTKVAEVGFSGSKVVGEGKMVSVGGGKLVSVEMATGKATAISEKISTNDLAVSKKGHAYLTETGKKQVTFVDLATGKAEAADTGIKAPNGIALSPDQSKLYVSDYSGTHVYTFAVGADGKLSGKSDAMTMKTPEGKPDNASGDGMTVDSEGRIYVTTAVGLQVFSAEGKLMGVLAKPAPGPLVSVAFAGKEHRDLYLACGGKIYKRKMQAAGK